MADDTVDGGVDTRDGVTELTELEAALEATPPAIAPLDDVTDGDALVRFDPLEETDRRGRARLDCPGCGASWLAPHASTPDARTGASSFCPDCDFPLFWAAAAAAQRRSHQAACRRFPGVDGRESIASLACWSCGEPNLPDPSVSCLRCGVGLTPPPPPAPPEPEPEIVYVEVPVSQRHWKIATAVVSSLLALAIAALWIGALS